MDYKSYVGPVTRYDLMGAIQFNLLTYIGLREHHTLLDVGCGSLRAGKLFIPYLLPNKYFGVEPNKWLIDEGIRKEVGRSQVKIKKPRFLYCDDWRFTDFNTMFDYIIAQSIFTHASSKQISDCMREAWKVLSDDGVFIANFEMGERNYEGDCWMYPEAVTYTFNHIIELGEAAGFNVYDFSWWHPGGHRWFALAKEGCETVMKYPEFIPAHITIPTCFKVMPNGTGDTRTSGSRQTTV